MAHIARLARMHLLPRGARPAHAFVRGQEGRDVSAVQAGCASSCARTYVSSIACPAPAPLCGRLAWACATESAPMHAIEITTHGIAEERDAADRPAPQRLDVEHRPLLRRLDELRGRDKKKRP